MSHLSPSLAPVDNESGNFTMSIKTFGAALAVAGVLFAASNAAQAADPGFCRNYANAALRQVDAVRSNPRCSMGAVGVRWSRLHLVHFNWCLGVPYAVAGRERDARTAYLRRCR